MILENKHVRAGSDCRAARSYHDQTVESYCLVICV